MAKFEQHPQQQQSIPLDPMMPPIPMHQQQQPPTMHPPVFIFPPFAPPPISMEMLMPPHHQTAPAGDNNNNSTTSSNGLPNPAAHLTFDLSRALLNGGGGNGAGTGSDAIEQPPMGGGNIDIGGTMHQKPLIIEHPPPLSLYVGDLDPLVNETILHEKFSTAGPVGSIRVCRDSQSGRSLGYAYVNFTNTEDAKKALETMNYDYMMGRPMRIMWSQRDRAFRQNTASNLFINNLGRHIDTKALYDTFSLFGKVLSCKVLTTPDGRSKCRGFVQFESDEVAQQAIEKVNGMMFGGKKIYVGKFIPRTELAFKSHQQPFVVGENMPPFGVNGGGGAMPPPVPSNHQLPPPPSQQQRRQSSRQWVNNKFQHHNHHHHHHQHHGGNNKISKETG